MLTDNQKAQVRLFLGYPDQFRYKHTRLEGVLDNLSPEAEDQVCDLLKKLVVADDALFEASTTGAGIKRVDEIWFDNGTVRVTTMRATGKRLVGRLSILTGVPVGSDYFGSGGYRGDSFSGPPNNGGGFFNLG